MPQNKLAQQHQMSGYGGWHQDYIDASQYQQEMTYKYGVRDQAYHPAVHGQLAQRSISQYQMQGNQQQQQQQQMKQQIKQQIKQQYAGQYAQLSTKDFNYLKDHMSWELLAAKKCAHYASECQDPQVAQLINQVGQMHVRHYNTLLAYINPQAVQ